MAPQQGSGSSKGAGQQKGRTVPTLGILAAVVGIILAIASYTGVGKQAVDPTDYALRTERILSTTPLIDGHNDLPYLLRIELQNKIYDNSTFTFRHGIDTTPHGLGPNSNSNSC